MRRKAFFGVWVVVFLAFFLGGCAQIELAIQVESDATIPRARIAVYVKDYTIFTQLRGAALSEYQKLSPEEREYVNVQMRDDAPPYVVAWEWRFPDEEKAKAFTKQFLGKSARLYQDQDLVILEAHLQGEELETALNSLGAGKVKPFLGSITLILKAYMPGEVVSYVEGNVEKNSVWKQEFNLGEVYQKKPTIDIEVISKGGAS
jgi:hypothetical protein